MIQKISIKRFTRSHYCERVNRFILNNDEFYIFTIVKTNLISAQLQILLIFSKQKEAPIDSLYTLPQASLSRLSVLLFILRTINSYNCQYHH